jgi:hypothetical protein
MTFSNEEIQTIIQRVTAEVAARLNSGNPPGRKVLAIIQGYVFNADRVFEYLKEKRADIAAFAQIPLPAELKRIPVDTDENKMRLAGSLCGYDEVLLVTPSITFLKELSLGNDAGFEAAMMIRPLLWGRKATILLDFKAPKFRRETLLAGLADTLDTLEKAGFGIESAAPEYKNAESAKALVTEQDVKNAYNLGSQRIKIAGKAIITQLAADTAKELGITIEF